jgi:Mn2+/Fe2+ NRAMP family transporter
MRAETTIGRRSDRCLNTSGMLINFIGVSPIRALFWTAVLNGLLAPPLLVLIMLVSNNKKVMDERVNSRWINALGLLTAAVGLLAAWGRS